MEKRPRKTIDFNRTPLEQAKINLKKSLEKKTKLPQEIRNTLVQEFGTLPELTFLNTDLFAIALWFVYTLDPKSTGRELKPSDFKDNIIGQFVESVPTNVKKPSPTSRKAPKAAVKINFTDPESRPFIAKIKANIYRYAKFIYDVRYKD